VTTARQITAALKGRWHGRYGMASCPSHLDGKTPALKISDDPRKSDGIDLHCFGGCPWKTIKSDLVRGGILEKWRPSNGPSYPKLKFTDDKPDFQENDNYENAKETWPATESIENTLAATYLVEDRGLQPPWPKWLRYHGAMRHGPTGLVFPCLVAGVVDGTGKFAAIHRTYLKLDGSGKAVVDPPKMALGALQDGTVRLGPAGKVLGLAEGIETGLSAQQLFEIPVWCVLGRRFDAVTIPNEVIELQIFADNGAPGKEAAAKGCGTFTTAGKRVAIRRPPGAFGDWNDALPHWHERPVEDWEF
jgi:hypothetical protein